MKAASQQEIKGFTAANGYGFLSNFHPSTFYYEDNAYSTVEHAYQCHKTLDMGSRDLIRRAKTPKEAKKLGRCLTLRPDWEEVKIPLMKSFIRKKFDNPLLGHLLLETGDAELIYDNTWNDKFWGVCRGAGQNWLGVILMDVRREIREASQIEVEIFGHAT